MSDSVQKIKDRLDIIDVISPYVELHKAGKNFKGKSPFTSEKTPSFFVSPDRGMYYCFSTSQGGDMFSFVQAMEGVDFKEALKILAEKAGVELVAEDPKKKTERERWHMALQAATDFYKEWLEKDSSAKGYLLSRGVSELTIAKWQIGFAPGPPDHGWRMVKDALEAKTYTREELLKTGLIKTTEGGKEPFDVFRDRIMFPLFDNTGKVVAFSGRILNKDSDAPKYVNSPETELYKKSELLYGYDKARQGIRTFDFSLIVEGQFDVVMCHQAGYNNTVAVSGTALTPHHVQLLERLSDRVVLALDADKAGIAAMKRAADVMLRRGIDVKVAEMPAGKDPADIIKEDAANFKKIVGHSVHVIEFMLHVLTQQYDDERTLKLKAREEILPFVLLLPNRIDQDHFVGVIAKAIGAATESIRFELDRLREEARHAPTPRDTELDTKATSSGSLLENVYTYVLAAAEVQAEIKKYIDAELKKIGDILPLPQVESSLLARTTFELSEKYNHRKEPDIYEEIALQMNHLRKESAKAKLGQLRSKNPDFMDTEEGIAILRQCEEIRKSDIYSKEELMGKKESGV